MSENTSILNHDSIPSSSSTSSNNFYEPEIKKRRISPIATQKIEISLYNFPNRSTDEQFRPCHSIFLTREQIELDISSLILNNRDDLYKKIELIKPKYFTGKRRCIGRINLEEIIIQLNSKETQLDQKENLYFVGEHQMELIKPDNINFDTTNFESFNYYIYESKIKYSTEPQEDFKFNRSVNPLKSYAKILPFIERAYYVMITNFVDSSQNESFETYFLNIKNNELSYTLLRLLQSKNVKLLTTCIKEHENKLFMNIEIYFTEKNLNESLINDDPSFSYLNSRNTMDVHYVVTHFFLSSKNESLENELLLNDNKLETDMDHDGLDEKSSNHRNENLFDLVYELHQKNTSYNDLISCKDDRLIQKLSCLKPDLRQYQINAIKWMLYKENFNFNKSNQSKNHNSTNDLHPLYVKIVNSQSETIYYHKYFGVYSKQMPLKKKSLPGGILADEMGLGKTLEILTLIMINRCEQVPIKYKPEVDIDKKKKELNKKSFSCLCGNAPNSFRYKDGFKDRKDTDEIVYQCIGCSVWSHIKCVNYTASQDEFLCLECCTKVSPIKSGCTLIVTPTIISHQWADEINKHVNKKLNVLVYKGTQNGFIQPRDLAAYDICVTTYDVLSNELSHVFAIENMKVLRKAKRFMNIPSPLICVEWWRICLDEAQMVHSTNSRCAEMANRLSAINRWCVTGTPIGRSLADLHGLFTFIREDPYTEKRWFKYCLFESFKSGNRMPMANAVSNVLWRTAKRFVEDQINIPKQTEKSYWLEFSPFESHLYQRVLESFKNSRKNSFKSTDNNHDNGLDDIENNNANQTEKNNVEKYFSKFSNTNLRIDEADRHMIDQILAPLLDLRLSCNHPQLVLRKRTFMPQNHHANKKEKLLTMEKSLEILLKKTQNECDNIFRLLTMNSNAIAGLHILNKDNNKAIEAYQKILDSEKEFDSNVKLDNVQKVHTYHNYIEILKMVLNEKESAMNDENFDSESIDILKSQIESLQVQLINCEKTYKIVFDEKKILDEKSFDTKVKELNKWFINQKNDALAWWIEAVDHIEKSSKSNEFWDKLGSEFSISSIVYKPKGENKNDESTNDETTSSDENTNVRIAYSMCGKTVKSFSELKLIFVNEFDNVINWREELVKKLSCFDQNKLNNQVVQQVADCHLRKNLDLNNATNKNTTKNKTEKCGICKADHTFNTYSKYLYSSSEDAIRLINNQNQEAFSDNEDEEFLRQQMQIRTRSDLEKFLKLVLYFIKNEHNFKEHVRSGKEFLETYGLLKEEFKTARQYWTSVTNLINAMDELEMAKTRLRLLEPNEKNPLKLSYLIEPGAIDLHFMKNYTDQKECRVNLNKKLGQMLYLKNSLKTFNLVENEENTEPCPICQSNLGFEWYILTCGHLYCKDCYLALLKNETIILLNAKKYVRCALCRESCAHSESHLVSTKKPEIENQDQVKNQNLNPIENDDNYEEYINSNYYRQLDELKNIKIQGNCNSAKIEGIVKCLIKIIREDKQAKCLVFSEHITMLDLIIDLLKQNFITYNLIKDTRDMQKKIEEFKKNLNMNVLLMPYSFGANGLNIIEATHVLLVEPTINKSQEIQAIGRVHRIGQTKPTFVYRFMIKNSIEELVFNMFKSCTSYSSNKNDNNSQLDFNKPMCSKTIAQAEAQSSNDQNKPDHVLTLNDIKNLFLKL